MQRNFFIQKADDPAKDIAAEWGVYINATRGILELPDLKTPFSRDWPEEQGLDEFVPDRAVFSSKDVEMDITYHGIRGVEQFRRFVAYLATPKSGQYTIENRDGVFQLYTPYRNSGARLRYSGMTFSKERYRTQKDLVQATLKFKCANGLSFGASTYGRPTNELAFDIKEGETIDVFYSDGSRDLNKTISFIKDFGVVSPAFCIINPSSIDAVIIN